MQEIFSAAMNRLEDEECQITQQRELIVKHLVQNSDRHPSAEDIYDSVRQENTCIGLATVYRTLQLLQKLGIVCRMDMGDGSARFELTIESTTPHIHLVCTECADVQEVQSSHAYQLEEYVVGDCNFQVSDRSIVFSGICFECTDNKT